MFDSGSGAGADCGECGFFDVVRKPDDVGGRVAPSIDEGFEFRLGQSHVECAHRGERTAVAAGEF